ncbi:DUF2147 domain-containing protein [Spirosoma oryzicola]|uniref:DUF2147 domain-containing protein n=1 Tax=Spirosoma oryzicola TaxID=2898794 RepID=UPI001E3630F3|nr:DUF2147 domain-containing protein [Spirosoma oryzicola]UHG94718.1 DUF2147 domain-containing protein [Spirosoma oryzicola]
MISNLSLHKNIVMGFMLFAAHPPKTHPVTGEWYTAGKESKITIAPCGDKFCGKITWLKNPATATKESGIGTQIIKDFEIVDDMTLEKGKIHDLRNDKWYNGRLKVGSDGKLEVRGWLGLPALGKSIYWTRAN